VLTVLLAGTYHGVDWDAHKGRFITEVIDYLSGGLLPGLAGHVQVADAATPLDYERRLGLGQGSLHGIAQDLGRPRSSARPTSPKASRASTWWDRQPTRVAASRR
jgi:phytoene dehydrogenase-like protein